jgi:hypothetical protein
MELAVRLAWLLLGLVHVAPAAVLVRPGLVEQLYGVAPDSPAALLLSHRGAAFLGIVVVSVWAAFDSDVRRLASVVLAISVSSFLLLYSAAGFPTGPLRTIALADGLALLPLMIVAWSAWR